MESIQKAYKELKKNYEKTCKELITKQLEQESTIKQYRWQLFKQKHFYIANDHKLSGFQNFVKRTISSLRVMVRRFDFLQRGLFLQQKVLKINEHSMKNSQHLNEQYCNMCSFTDLEQDFGMVPSVLKASKNNKQKRNLEFTKKQEEKLK